MTLKERLKGFIKYKGISVRSFEIKCGLSNGYISNMRVSIQPEKMSCIAEQFPELNMGWLMTGEGEMIKAMQQESTTSNRTVSISVEAWDVIKKQAESLKVQADSLERRDRQIDELISIIRKENALKANDAEPI